MNANKAAAGHILAVDDNKVNRLLLSRALQELGYTFELAENGRQALAMVRQQAFDAMLLDIVMPVMDGYQVLEYLKGDPALRQLPVIVISAVDDLDSVIRCIEMGAEDYLPKPFNPLLLKARLGASLEKKKLHDLEKAYLEQEMRLQTSEKLASIGRLSAGMAHELNNPAAATQRGALQLGKALHDHRSASMELLARPLEPPQIEALTSLERRIAAAVAQPAVLDPMQRSDLESELEDWLEAFSVTQAWELAPTLAAMFHSRDDLSQLESSFPRERIPPVTAWLASLAVLYELSASISQGAERIGRIVNALKSYTNLDQAPLQEVDLNECLDSTLAILEYRLEGVEINKEYGSLPRVPAYPLELNQVWLHLLDNALDALQGKGSVTLRTRWEDPAAVVEVEDTGPGIPQELQHRIFTPFFTTKPPGQGVGLGLSSSWNIVVNKHRGEMAFSSSNGYTRFQVRLPRQEFPD